MRHKKATTSLFEILGSMAIVGAILIILILATGRRLELFERSVNPTEIAAINSLCGARSQQFGSELKEPIEGAKGDGFSDDCDNCLGGDNRKVSNSYGISDDCYLQPTRDNKIKTYKDMCKARGGCYIPNKDQCCVGEAISRCGPECK